MNTLDFRVRLSNGSWSSWQNTFVEDKWLSDKGRVVYMDYIRPNLPEIKCFEIASTGKKTLVMRFDIRDDQVFLCSDMRKRCYLLKECENETS